LSDDRGSLFIYTESKKTLGSAKIDQETIMNGRLSILLFALILTGLILIALVVTGYGLPTRSVGPQQPVGPQGSVGPQEPIGPDVAKIRREADTQSIFGVDWVFVAASALVLAALGFGIAVGYGTRKQLLDQ
jgi:hypothetical protein